MVRCHRIDKSLDARLGVPIIGGLFHHILQLVGNFRQLVGKAVLIRSASMYETWVL